MIVRLNKNTWQVRSRNNKNLGTYHNEKEAKKRLQQVEYFKHKNHSEDQKYFVSLKNFNDITFAHVKGPVYGFNEAKEALLNLIMANKEDFAEGTIRPWQKDDVKYKIKTFVTNNVKKSLIEEKNDMIDLIKDTDKDLYDSMMKSKKFVNASMNYGPKQMVKIVKDPKEYKKYVVEAKNNIKTSVKNAPEYFKKNKDEIIPTSLAIPAAIVGTVVPIPGAGVVAPAAVYTAADYGQRKAKKIANIIKENIQGI